MKFSLLASALIALSPMTLSAQPPSQMSMPAGAPMQHDKPPVKPSHSLNITFDGHTITLSTEDLLNLPQQTITAHDGHADKDVTFSGPLVADVLAKAGLLADPKNHALILHSSVIATGSDGYYVLYSAAELEPMFSSGKAIIAVMQSGLPVPSGIQLILPSDTKPARWVHALANLNVMSVATTK